ncbi:LysR family transcriptional regulator [Pseudonocardia nigra]|uniref:LysR family transcriptional regulator n=1 Tax=Pseudonocardia nigra TaxID=1921578 RepID=UPI001C5F1615|nr:LysR family transcriptional regulator [Pseudonocardia nigra]
MLRTDVRLEWFVSFLAVVDTGSFVAAAESTHRSQPRVSMHVAALERGVGVPLFNRRKRPVELTDAGVALAVHARAILDELDATEAAMAAWRGGTRGVVTLGSHPSASAAFVPAVLQQAAAASPDVRVVLVERSTLELDEALAAGEVDLCLRPMSPPPARPSVHGHPLWQEPLVVLHPPDHPLARLPEPLSVAAVAEHPLLSIGRLAAPETGEFESYRLFRERGYELEPVQATNQPQTLMAMARHGLGVGVTNWLAAHVADTSGLQVRRLEGGCGRRVAVFWDSARVLTAASRSLLKEIMNLPRPPGTEAVPVHAGGPDSAVE